MEEGTETVKKALTNMNGQAEAGSNMYTASIHCICSGLRKLCRAQVLEVGMILYRGFRGMALPPQFFDADAQGCRGGVECGLMSTSPHKEVAIGYSGVDTGKELPTVFVIKVGKTSVAADISWLSQFEDEKEFLFGPLTHLQVVGQPEVVEHAGKDMSLVHLDLTVPAIYNLFFCLSQYSIPCIVVSVRDAALLYVFRFVFLYSIVYLSTVHCPTPHPLSSPSLCQSALLCAFRCWFIHRLLGRDDPTRFSVLHAGFTLHATGESEDNNDRAG